MSEKRTILSMPVVPLVISGLVILFGCVLVGVAIYMLFFSPGGVPGEAEPTATAVISRTMSFPTITPPPAEGGATDEPAPAPTEPPQEEEQPTEEQVPTDVPAPTDPPPTNPPPPPPTATDTPPLPTATAATSGRLTNASFTVDNPVVGVNQQIKFNFSVTNGTSEHMVFGPLGVAVYDINWVNLHFHTSWTEWDLDPGQTENWTDGVAIGTPGTYYLQLSVCYDCNQGGSDWEDLASPVEVTVN